MTKKLIFLSIFFLLISISFISAQSDNKQEINRYSYNNCGSWDNWQFCEKGHFHEYLIRDEQGKGHLIFKNVGQWKVYYGGEIIWRGVDHDTVFAQSNSELPTYWTLFDFDKYIFKDLDYEFNETTFCTNYRFYKENNGETLFSRDITNCYPA